MYEIGNCSLEETFAGLFGLPISGFSALVHAWFDRYITGQTWATQPHLNCKRVFVLKIQMMNPFFRTCGGALHVHGQDLLVNFSLLHLMDDNILFPQEVFAFLLMQSYQPQTSEKTVLVRSEFNNPILKTPDTLYQEKMIPNRMKILPIIISQKSWDQFVKHLQNTSESLG